MVSAKISLHTWALASGNSPVLCTHDATWPVEVKVASTVLTPAFGRGKVVSIDGVTGMCKVLIADWRLAYPSRVHGYFPKGSLKVVPRKKFTELGPIEKVEFAMDKREEGKVSFFSLLFRLLRFRVRPPPPKTQQRLNLFRVGIRPPLTLCGNSVLSRAIERGSGLWGGGGGARERANPTGAIGARFAPSVLS